MGPVTPAILARYDPHSDARGLDVTVEGKDRPW